MMSPSYPTLYSGGCNCGWRLRSANGWGRIQLSVMAGRLPPGDRLEFADSTGAVFQTCSSESCKVVKSMGSEMEVGLRADGGSPGACFVMEIRVIGNDSDTFVTTPRPVAASPAARVGVEVYLSWLGGLTLPLCVLLALLVWRSSRRLASLRRQLKRLSQDSHLGHIIARDQALNPDVRADRLREQMAALGYEVPLPPPSYVTTAANTHASSMSLPTLEDSEGSLRSIPPSAYVASDTESVVETSEIDGELIKTGGRVISE